MSTHKQALSSDDISTRLLEDLEIVLWSVSAAWLLAFGRGPVFECVQDIQRVDVLLCILDLAVIWPVHIQTAGDGVHQVH